MIGDGIGKTNTSSAMGDGQGWDMCRVRRSRIDHRLPAVTVAAAGKCGGHVVDEQAEADVAAVKCRAGGRRKVRQVHRVESGDGRGESIRVMMSRARVCRQRSKL